MITREPLMVAYERAYEALQGVRATARFDHGYITLATPHGETKGRL